MENQRRVGENVRQMRQDRGWSLAELSAKLDAAGHPISVGGLSKLELGDRRILVDDLVELAGVFDVDMNTLVTDPGALRHQRTARLWEEHHALMARRRELEADHEQALEAIDAQLDAIEDRLTTSMEGRADLQLVVRQRGEHRRGERS